MAEDDRRIPYDEHAEAAVIGAMMLNPDAILDATDMLRSEDFYTPAHATIFDAILHVTADGGRADLVTLHAWLDQHGQLDAVGGHRKLVDIHQATPAPSSVAKWARVVASHATHRKVISAGTTITELGYTGYDAAETIDAAEATLYHVADQRTGDPTHKPIADTIRDHIADLEAARHDPETAGIPTGFHELDLLIGGGMRAGQLIVVAGRPAMGKSVLTGQVALNASRRGHPAVIVSLEMGREELTDRLIANVSGLDLHLIRARRYGDIDMRRIEEAGDRLEQLPLDIDDNASATLLAVRSAVRRTARRHGRCDLVIVDYLQLMSSLAGQRRTENRQVEVADLSRGLKILARDLALPVVALSQLNRSVEMRADKRPMLADLRESGAIENDADIVIGLYRDEYYAADSADRGTVEVLVLKQRMGPTGMVRLGFLGATQRLANLATVKGAA